MDVGSPAFQVAGLLNEANFPLYQHLSLECWLSGGEQPDLRSVTETLSFFLLPTGKTKAMWKDSLSIRQPLAWACPCSCRGSTLTAAACPRPITPEAVGSAQQLSHGKAGSGHPLGLWPCPGEFLLSFTARFTRDGRSHLLCSLASLLTPRPHQTCSRGADDPKLPKFYLMLEEQEARGPASQVVRAWTLPLPTGACCLPPHPPQRTHPENPSNTAWPICKGFTPV